MADRYFRLKNARMKPAVRRRGDHVFVGEQPVKVGAKSLKAVEADPHLIEVVNVAGKGEKPRWKPKAGAVAKAKE